MPSFGQKSQEKLAELHPDLQSICNEVIKHYDFAITTGHRKQEEQDALYPKFTNAKWPDSEHNSKPSRAFDGYPYPIDWKNHKEMYLLAGYILMEAIHQGIGLKWGIGKGKKKWDLGHFELT